MVTANSYTGVTAVQVVKPNVTRDILTTDAKSYETHHHSHFTPSAISPKHEIRIIRHKNCIARFIRDEILLPRESRLKWRQIGWNLFTSRVFYPLVGEAVK